jgi:glycosyltransferase involved in cell wall biosynthesis
MKKNSKNRPIKVLIVQQINRAYRVPLLKKLATHPNINLTMIYGTNKPVQAGDAGISIATDPMPFRTIKAKIEGIRLNGRELLWFNKALKLIKNEFFDVVICDYYTRMLSIWPMQKIQHKRNASFILWGIGFHQYPTPLLDVFRKLMVNRSDALLLYSEKEKIKYTNIGVPVQKCFVTQNTVDIEGIDAAVSAATGQQVLECKKKTESENGPVLMHIGRLAKNKRLDILIKILPALKKRWPFIRLILIGEGPEMESLKKMAKSFSVQECIKFIGPITDHKLLAPWVLASDLFVAPAQIGLMAPMCLTYGKTLVISDVAEHHGPEVQAFVPGKTGLSYHYEDSEDLINSINKLLDNPKQRKQFAKIGSNRVRKLMGPEQMLDAFIDAINYVTFRDIR